MMKPIVYTYNPWNTVKFRRRNGHIHIWAGIFSTSNSFTKLSFIFDTGAYITVISRKRAQRIGLPLTGTHTANLTGINKELGSNIAEIVVVPKIEIGKIIIEDVQILVPLEEISIPLIIGENILEYLNYTMDHGTDSIYFAKNPNPKPYKNIEKGIDLSCGRVLLQDAM